MIESQQEQVQFESTGTGAQVPYDSISEPGTYVSNWTGHLLRVPEEAILSGRSPTMEIHGSRPLFVTKISDDPYLPISKARLIAANCDVAIDF